MDPKRQGTTGLRLREEDQPDLPVVVAATVTTASCVPLAGHLHNTTEAWNGAHRHLNPLQGPPAGV